MAEERQPIQATEPEQPVAAPAEPEVETPEGLIASLIQSAEARAGLYGLVSALNSRMLNQKNAGPVIAVIDAADKEGDGLMAQGFSEMMAYLSDATTANFIDLSVDFGLGIELLPSGLTGGGMELAKDYLGSACSSMSMMCQRQAEFLKMGDLEGALRILRVQQDMYTSRLEQWVDDYCNKVDAEVKTAFYRGASKFTRGFVHEEKLYIADSVAAVEELIAGTV